MLNRLRNEKVPIILVFLFSLLFVCVFTPYIYEYYLIFPLILSFLSVFVLVLYDPYFFLNNAFIVVLFIYTVLVFMYRISGISTAAYGNYASYFINIATIIVCVFILEKGDLRCKKILTFLIICLLLVNTISSIVVYSTYPDLLVSLLKSDYYGGRFGKLNVGSTSFVYSLLFCTIFLYKNFLILKGIKKVLCFVLFCFFSYYIFFFGKSSTIMLSWIIAVYLITFIDRNSYQKKVFGVLLLTLLLFAFVVFGNPILDKLSYVALEISGTKAYERVMAIKNVFFGNVDSDSLSVLSRFELLRIDIDYWTINIRTFLFGNGYHTYASTVESTDVISNAIINYSGGHSGLIDVLPKYGILGFGIVVCAIYFGHKKIKSIVGPTFGSIITIVLLLFVFNSIFNSIFTYNVLATIIIGPCFLNTQQVINNKCFGGCNETFNKKCLL